MVSLSAAVLDPFWRPVHEAIVRRLRGTACILAESGEYVTPAAARLRADMPPTLVSNDDLRATCDGV